MKFAFFVAGFVVAALLAGIYVWRKSPMKPFSGGDDEPIVVAGGSLEIGSRNGFDPDAGGDLNKAHHTQKHRSVNRVEVLYNNPDKPGQDGGPAYTEIIPSQPQLVMIDITYCKNKCASTPDDTVTFNTDGNSQNLGVSNSDKNRPIGKINPGSKKVKHVEANWQVNQISVTVGSSPKTDYPCDNGKCQVVLHYYCPTLGPTDCQ